MIVHARLAGGKGILALPSGTSRIEDLRVGEVQRNRLGTVKVQDGPALVTYRAFFSPGAAPAAPPDERDLRVPGSESPVISRIAMDLGLASQPPQQILRTLSSYFEERFRYTLVQRERNSAFAPLEDFLLRSRSGHCEYFATATVLLLRQAGVPARYATGYMVQEFSRLENRYIVRARHAHAWALAYVEGSWHSFDTTPSAWMALEEENSSWHRGLSDLWSWVAFHASRWWNAVRGSLRGYLGWLAVPLGALLVWRWYGSSLFPRLRRRRRDSLVVRSWPGQDSEFYTLEKRLAELGLGRHPWEPLGRWAERVEGAKIQPASAEPLRVIISLHNRYRFDPNGIGPTERERLKSQVQSWLMQMAAKESRP
jgi:transglutaminase-like putative cysteine protease